jgi:predicted RNA-binding protein with TRAM domain
LKGKRFNRGFKYPIREAPVKEGEEYDVIISEISRRGDGITRIKNFVVFVPETKRGDKVKIRIKELRGRAAVAEVI